MEDLETLGWTTLVNVPNYILEALKNSPSTQSDYHNHTKRIVHYHHISQNIEGMLLDAIAPFIPYLRSKVRVAYVQRIPLTASSRTQRLHRDHPNGPRKAITLAISDRPLGTVLFSRSHLDENDDRNRYDKKKLNCNVAVYDPYILHHSPASSSNNENRFFIQILSTEEYETTQSGFSH